VQVIFHWRERERERERERGEKERDQLFYESFEVEDNSKK